MVMKLNQYLLKILKIKLYLKKIIHFLKKMFIFQDKVKRISVYYDAITKQYIGYAENYKKFMKNESYKA